MSQVLKDAESLLLATRKDTDRMSALRNVGKDLRPAFDKCLNALRGMEDLESQARQGFNSGP